MKEIKTLMETIQIKIKKKFFNKKKDKFMTACEKLKEMAGEIIPAEELKRMEEYVCNYNTTTRWQTV